MNYPPPPRAFLVATLDTYKVVKFVTLVVSQGDISKVQTVISVEQHALRM
jgi:hypothetical protein